MNEIDIEVRVALYEHFAEHGHPPVAAEVAERLGVSPHEVEGSFQRMHDAHMIVLAPGTPYVWMANPFSALPTPYRAESSDGRAFWGNCVWDALGILAMLGGSGRFESRCPDCGDQMTVDVDGDHLEGQGLVHFAVPARHWWDDIGFN